VTDIITIDAADPEESGEGTVRSFSEPARRLMEAADRLFYAQGAAATTVREITAACGLTPGALYNHFTSKDELVFTLVRYRHAHLEDNVVRAQAAAGPDPAARLAAIVGVYVRMHVGGREGAEVANREYRHLPGPQREEIVAIRRRLRDSMVAVLADGARQGIFDVVGASDPGTVEEHRALAITAATILDMCIHGASWLHRDGALDADGLAAHFTALALRLAGRRTAPPATPPS